MLNVNFILWLEPSFLGAWGKPPVTCRVIFMEKLAPDASWIMWVGKKLQIHFSLLVAHSATGQLVFPDFMHIFIDFQGNSIIRCKNWFQFKNSVHHRVPTFIPLHLFPLDCFLGTLVSSLDAEWMGNFKPKPMGAILKGGKKIPTISLGIVLHP